MGARPHYVVIDQTTEGEWFYEVRSGNNKATDVSDYYKRKGTAVNLARTAYPKLTLREYVQGRLINLL